MAPGSDTRRVVGLLFSAYPTPTVQASTRSAYAQMLADLPPDDLEDAVMSAIATMPRLPSIAELRSLVIERHLDAPTPMLAWESVRTKDGRAGAHPLARHALDLVGGPWALRQTDKPEILRAQFLRAYEDLRREAVNAASLDSAGLALGRGSTLEISRGGTT